MQNVGPNLFVCNENSAYIMPFVVMSCTHRTVCGKLAALYICGVPGITYGHAIHASQTIYLSKITASHFSTLNMKIAKQNVLKRILVENLNTRLFLISCSQGILSSSSFSFYLLLRLLVYMYLSQLMRTFTNYLKCIVIPS